MTHEPAPNARIQRQIPTFLATLVLACSNAAAITPNAAETELGRLIRTHAGQKRSEMIHDPMLHAVARAKALDLGRRNYRSHVDPDGFGPNRVASLVGYQLPSWYGSEPEANNVESLGLGPSSPAQQFSVWLGSANHRKHVLGTESFWAEQTHYGVGYADVPGSSFRRYYVFISAPPPESGVGSGEYVDWVLQRFPPKSLDGTDDLTDHDGDGIPRIQEFVLGFEPRTANVLPSPVFSPSLGRLEWRLPLRNQIGSLKARVEHSFDMRSWSPDGVDRGPDGLFSIRVHDGRGFLRLVTER